MRLSEVGELGLLAELERRGLAQHIEHDAADLGDGRIVTQDALTEWQIAMATAVLAMLPPVLVVVLMQRLFVKGLVETEK